MDLKNDSSTLLIDEESSRKEVGDVRFHKQSFHFRKQPLFSTKELTLRRIFFFILLQIKLQCHLDSLLAMVRMNDQFAVVFVQFNARKLTEFILKLLHDFIATDDGEGGFSHSSSFLSCHHYITTEVEKQQLFSTKEKGTGAVVDGCLCRGVLMPGVRAGEELHEKVNQFHKHFLSFMPPLYNN
jgi:hypothetical protein